MKVAGEILAILPTEYPIPLGHDVGPLSVHDILSIECRNHIAVSSSFCLLLSLIKGAKRHVEKHTLLIFYLEKTPNLFSTHSLTSSYNLKGCTGKN